MGIYSKEHRLQDEALSRAPAYPAGRFAGRGIVTCAGGPRYFTCAWVLVRVLRDLLRTALPIQVWHRGAAEMDPAMQALLERYGVEVVDACRIEGHPAPSEGWALKPFAILHSRFQEVVFVDADNIPTADPAILLEAPAYRETGALFWPDLDPLPAESAVWEICRVPYRQEPSFESGQMVLDKARSWKPLLLAMHMNERADFYYQHFHGDKDTFHLSWRRLEQLYGMVPHGPRKIGNAVQDLFTRRSFVLGQHDFQGRVIFQHRNWPKFILFGRNARYPELLYEPECLGFLDELAGLWDGRVQTEAPPPPAESKAGGPGRWFRYVLVSHGERWLELRPDQTIGYGGMQHERSWRVIPDGAVSVLEIFGDRYLTSRLTRHTDGVWRGRWLWDERCPVELIPLSEPRP